MDDQVTPEVVAKVRWSSLPANDSAINWGESLPTAIFTPAPHQAFLQRSTKRNTAHGHEMEVVIQSWLRESS